MKSKIERGRDRLRRAQANAVMALIPDLLNAWDDLNGDERGYLDEVAPELCDIYDPRWFYLLRARLSGELREYRETAAKAGFIPLGASDREWFAWIRDRLATLGREKRGDAVAYVNPGRA